MSYKYLFSKSLNLQIKNDIIKRSGTGKFSII